MNVFRLPHLQWMIATGLCLILAYVVWQLSITNRGLFTGELNVHVDRLGSLRPKHSVKLTETGISEASSPQQMKQRDGRADADGRHASGDADRRDVSGDADWRHASGDADWHDVNGDADRRDVSGDARCAQLALKHESVETPGNDFSQIGVDKPDTVLPPTTSIPHIIHQIWQSEYVHKSFSGYIKSWPNHNHNWTHVLWTQDMSRHFIAKMYPQYLKLYDSYSHTIYRADVARYFILYTFGGVYMDLDIECLQPLDIVDRHACILSQEPDIHRSLLHKRNSTMVSNAFMGCRPKHPFFKLVIEKLPEFFKKTDDLLGSTGPLMLDEVSKNYLATKRHFSAQEELFVAPGNYFQPTFDEMNKETIHASCDVLLSADVNDDVCQERLQKVGPAVLLKQTEDCATLARAAFSNKPQALSYSDHHWVHTYWYPVKYHGRRGVENVSYKELIPQAITGDEIASQIDS